MSSDWGLFVAFTPSTVSLVGASQRTDSGRELGDLLGYLQLCMGCMSQTVIAHPIDEVQVTSSPAQPVEGELDSIRERRNMWCGV